MTKIYACLLGEWVCLNDDPDCLFFDTDQSPGVWWEENAPVFSPANRNGENSYYYIDYVKILYKGSLYRINPIFIQARYG